MSTNKDKKKKDIEIIRARANTSSGAVVTVGGAARELIREFKGGYQDLRGTFNVTQVELSSRYGLDAKIQRLEDDLEIIKVQGLETKKAVDEIADQTRDPTLFERIENSILDNIIGMILVFVIGVIIAWLGFTVFS